MKVKARIEQSLFKTIDKLDDARKNITTNDDRTRCIKLAERQKVLEWVLSDKVEDIK